MSRFVLSPESACPRRTAKDTPGADKKNQEKNKTNKEKKKKQKQKRRSNPQRQTGAMGADLHDPVVQVVEVALGGELLAPSVPDSCGILVRLPLRCLCMHIRLI